jgi:hypothetical protein
MRGKQGALAAPDRTRGFRRFTASKNKSLKYRHGTPAKGEGMQSNTEFWLLDVRRIQTDIGVR